MQARAVLLDLDGTVYQDGALVPGAAEAVDRLRAALPVRFVTNTTSRSRADVVAKLGRLGLAVDASEISVPALAAAERLRQRGETAALFVADRALADFEDVAQSDEAPDWVVLGDLGDGWTADGLNRVLGLLTGGAGLLALAGTTHWRGPDGLRLDVGAYTVALAAASGVEPVVVGKPSAAFFLAPCQALGADPADVWMVGDDAATDVRAAQDAGLRGALVRTGKFRDSDLDGTPAPGLVLDSLADLPDALGV